MPIGSSIIPKPATGPAVDTPIGAELGEADDEFDDADDSDEIDDSDDIDDEDDVEDEER
ncbi:hypothetical protein ACWCO3_33930 [Micromonospora sp. NPDC002411]